jgi:hypothetical protein
MSESQVAESRHGRVHELNKEDFPYPAGAATNMSFLSDPLFSALLSVYESPESSGT